MQNVFVDLVELANIFRKVAVEPGAGLRERKVQVHSHFGLHIRRRPVFGIGAAQEGGDLIAVGVPFGASGIDFGLYRAGLPQRS